MFNLKSRQNIQPVFPVLTLFYAEFIWFDGASVTRIKSSTGMWLYIFELKVPMSRGQWVLFMGFHLNGRNNVRGYRSLQISTNLFYNHKYISKYLMFEL